MSASRRSTRRSFLKSAMTTGAALAAGSHLGCAQGEKTPVAQSAPVAPPPPPETQPETPPEPTAPQFPDLRIAYVATGGIGGYHLKTTHEMGVQCPCFCDVDTGRMATAVELFPHARPYQDYREMFDKEHKNFDAVMIGTPDHHHYPATVIALQLGKHVYTQKPLTHTVWEARQLARAAQQYKVATQMGNQGHAREGWRLVYEWIHSGALGDIVETHTWTDRPVWPQGMERPEGVDEIPAALNWDAWLGPAPDRPFKDKAYHPFVWRGWWDFGAGALGDMACHTMDGIFWALNPGSPTAIEPIASTVATAEAFPNAAMLKWEFPARGHRRAFTAYWYDGGLQPTLPADLELGRKLPGTGNLFIGTKASLLVAGDYGDSPRIFPEAKMRAIGKPPQLLERSPGHVEEWVMAAAGAQPLDFPKSSFAYAGPFTEVVLLGNIALRMGRRLEWDAEALRFTNLPEANQFVTKEYRAGWKFEI